MTPLEYGMALIGSSANYLDTSSTATASTTSLITNFSISNVRSEGYSPRLMLFHILSNVDNFTVSNVWVEKWAPAAAGTTVSYLVPFTDSVGDYVTRGADSPNGFGLVIEDFNVGETPEKMVTIASNNYGPNKLGRLNFSSSLTGHWTAVI